MERDFNPGSPLTPPTVRLRKKAYSDLAPVPIPLLSLSAGEESPTNPPAASFTVETETEDKYRVQRTHSLPDEGGRRLSSVPKLELSCKYNLSIGLQLLMYFTIEPCFCSILRVLLIHWFFHFSDSVWRWISCFKPTHTKPSWFASVPDSPSFSDQSPKSQDAFALSSSTNHNRKRTSWIRLHSTGYSCLLRRYELLQSPSPCVGKLICALENFLWTSMIEWSSLL